MRYVLGIEYDGSSFLGWQSQRQTPTVQATLEAALGQVADEEVRLICAGRTDTGVHARCQVAHFDTGSTRSERSWVLGANSHLPETVSVLWAREVDEDFHARFSAFARRYRYVILNRWVRPAIEHGLASWYRTPLDEAAMHQAAQALMGEHDFTSFRSAGCKANHAVREISEIRVSRLDDHVMLDITANGFLYHMVRNIAGSLIAVGKGEQDPEWMGQLLNLKDRRQAGVTARPDGLYFMGVRYPRSAGLPEGPESYPAASGLGQ